MPTRSFPLKLLAITVLLAFWIAGCETVHLSRLASIVEEYPAWDRPDLSLVALTVKPDRLEHGERAILRATVSNVGTGDALPGHVVFSVGGNDVARILFPALGPSTSHTVETTWIAEETTNNRVLATLDLESKMVDWGGENDVREAIAFVRSSRRDVQGLSAQPPEVEPTIPKSGEPAVITIKLRNLGFTAIEQTSVALNLDDVVLDDDRVVSLGPGEDESLKFTWKRAEPGQHLLTISSKSGASTFSKDLACTTWLLEVWQQKVLYDSFQKDKWVSIGPKIIDNGSVGRIDRIAIHPSDPKVLYVGAPTGGLWKSNDGGLSWEPLTDGLRGMRIGAIAIDPRFPQIVYIGIGHPWHGERVSDGIFKSVDGGKTWDAFASEFVDKSVVPAVRESIDGVGKIVLRYDSAGQIVIYVTTRHGLLRFIGNKPFDTSTHPTDWHVIKRGLTYDVAVDPSDPSRIYLPVYEEITVPAGNKRILEAVFRTDHGMTAVGDGAWEPMQGLPPKQKLNGLTTLDIFPLDPKVLFAAIFRGSHTRVYESEDGGDSWRIAFLQKESYNDFIRVHPKNKSKIYFGGIKLWQANWYADVTGLGLFSGWQTQEQFSGHVDQKAMAFLPRGLSADPDAYYLANDGGVWYCDKLSLSALPSSAPPMYTEVCNSRNNDLRVTQFYDIDSSPTHSTLMIGGTQDNGTVLFRGNPVWQEIKGGDGNYSLIGPGSDPVMYAQHQCLNDDWGTQRRAGLTGDWQNAKNGLPQDEHWCWGRAQIVQHPIDPDRLMAQGDQLYYTQDGGRAWNGLVPTNMKGEVTRVAVQPYSGDRWVFGTSEGQIWQRVKPWMTMQFEHPDGAAVRRLAFSPVDPRILYATFSEGRFDHRIVRFELPPGTRGEWTSDPIGGGFPCDLVPLAVAGDGHRADVAYVGTMKGVFRWNASTPIVKRWQPYNDGLPLVEIRDLLVDMTSKQLRAATWGRGVWSVVTEP